MQAIFTSRMSCQREASQIRRCIVPLSGHWNIHCTFDQQRREAERPGLVSVSEWDPWLERDTIGFSGAMNQYAYCAGQPVGNIDPSGLQWAPPLAPWALGGSASATSALAGRSALSGMAAGGPAAAGAPLLMAGAAYGGWQLGQMINRIPAVQRCQAGLGSWLAGGRDYLPADPRPHKPTNSKHGNDKGRGDDPAWTMPLAELEALMKDELAAGNHARYRQLLRIYKQRRKKPRDGSQG